MQVDADVAVIGAGLAGLATAYWLVARGYRVLVLERDAAIGQRASGGTAAMGRQLHDDDETSRLTIAGAAWLRACGVEGVWQPTGGLLAFATAAERDDMAARGARLGVACAATNIAPGPWRLGADYALSVPSDGLIGTAALMAHWASATNARGAVICDAEVLLAASVPIGGQHHNSHHVRHQQIEVTTTRGVFYTRVVVNAAGAWADSVALRLGLSSRTRPTIRHVGQFAAPEIAGPFVWHVSGTPHYVRPVANAVWVSACDEGPCSPKFDAVVDPQEALRIDALAVTLTQSRTSGGLASKSASSASSVENKTAKSSAPPILERVWSCTRTFSTNGSPCVIEFDALAPWLCWVAALGAHGATTAVVVGQQAADTIAAQLGPPALP